MHFLETVPINFDFKSHRLISKLEIYNINYTFVYASLYARQNVHYIGLRYTNVYKCVVSYTSLFVRSCRADK